MLSQWNRSAGISKDNVVFISQLLQITLTQVGLGNDANTDLQIYQKFAKKCSLAIGAKTIGIKMDQIELRVGK